MLQRDAPASTASIAEHINLSQSPCWRRINRLEQEGLIRDRVALLVDHGRLWQSTTAPWQPLHDYTITARVINTGPARIEWFAGGDLYMVRPGANEFGVTLDGTEPDMKKNDYVEVDASNRLKKPSVFSLDKDGRLPYAMWFYLASDQEPFLGVNQILEKFLEKVMETTS